MIQNFVYFSLLFIGLTSCKTEKMTLQEGTMILKYQQPVIVDSSTKTLLTFTAVQDSRCPENTNCIWAGSVAVDLVFGQKNQKKKDLKLCLGCRQGADSISVVDLAGRKYRVVLQSVNPYPHAEKTKKEKYYSLSVKIDKISQ
jgi:hypothetical protein